MHLRTKLFITIASAFVTLSAYADLTAGKVVDLNGEPVPRASVIVRETLEAARTRDDGTFTVELPESGKVTISVVPEGEDAVDFPINVRSSDPLVIRIQRVSGQAVSMSAVKVMAGDYPTGATPGAALTALEVITTPGAMGDVNRALQTMPGVQNFDEGNGLYVRGGNYWETGAFINGSLFPSAVRLEAPTSTFVGTVNPFLTEKISFKSGGFGAEYGNLLSGVVALETQGKPNTLEGTLNVGLGALSLGGSLPIGKTFGIRATATVFDLDPSIRVNGSPRQFDPAPRGQDISASAIWNYREGAELKLFAIDQTQRLGVELDQPSFSGFYSQRRRSGFAVLSLKDHIGEASVQTSLSSGTSHSTDILGDLNVELSQPSTRWTSQVAYSVSEDFGLVAGAEAEFTKLRVAGHKPSTFDSIAPGADAVDVESRVTGTRTGLYLEGDWTPLPRLRVIAGGRTDRSTLTGERTFDPRFSAAYTLTKGVQLTAATGVYHQVADSLFYDPALLVGAPPSMRATHAIVGIQFGEGARQLRIEAYHKEYRDIIQFTRDRGVSQGGIGSAQGLDFFAKSPLPAGLTGRVTVSLIDTHRTDPDTGILSPTPFGVRSSVTVIVERSFGPRYKAGLSWRSASGKPFTEITGATYDAGRQVYTPTFGSPFAAKLPEYQRLDFSMTGVAWGNKRLLTAWYLSVSDVLGRANVSDYTYSADYRVRSVIPNTFNRSVYIGMSLLYR